jgi:hypothetical protein
MAKKKPSKKKMASKKSPGKKRMTQKQVIDKLQGPNVKLKRDETRVIETEFGKAEIKRAKSGKSWSLYVNEKYQGTFKTDSDAINRAKRLLSRPLVSGVKFDDISDDEP